MKEQGRLGFQSFTPGHYWCLQEAWPGGQQCLRAHGSKTLCSVITMVIAGSIVFSFHTALHPGMPEAFGGACNSARRCSVADERSSSGRTKFGAEQE